jgi:beta-aspartyl-peptidase (threonine type)
VLIIYTVMKNKTVILVHGGAWDIPDEVVSSYREGVEKAVIEGADVLERGGSALDAVEKAVRIMEDDPTFNAGCGSHLTDDGTVQMDAIIMDGATLKLGAAGAVENVKNPITLARHIMEYSEHNILVGGGALIYAVDAGLEMVETEKLIVGKELERFKRLRRKEDKKDIFEGGRDTVGAVALDGDGNLASATSTGGTPGKHRGRVGDSPLPGCGTMAENGVCAVSCTGWGEAIMEIRMAEYSAFAIIDGLTPGEACKEAIKRLLKVENGRAGLILVGEDGRWGWDFNTPRMARACIVGSDEPIVEID